MRKDIAALACSDRGTPVGRGPVVVRLIAMGCESSTDGGNLRTRHPHDYPDAAYTDPYLIRRPFTFLKASQIPALRKSCPG